MRKRIFLVLIIIVFLVTTLTGCMSTTEFNVDTTLVIQGIGVDFDYDKGEYKVTLLCYDLHKAGGGDDAKKSGESTKIIIGQGQSIDRAINDTVQITGENAIMTQNKVIILSETVVENGLDTVMDTFARNYRIRSTVPVAIAKNFEAGDILVAVQNNQTVPVDTIKNILQAEDINTYISSVTIADVIRLHEEKTTSVVIPAMTITEENGNLFTKLVGLAIFKNDKLYKFIDNKETRSLLAIVGKLGKGTTVTEKTPLGIATFEILKSKTKSKIIVNKDNSLKYSVDLKLTLDLTELDFKAEHGLSEKDIKELQESTNRYWNLALEKFLEKLLVDYRCDIFRIGKRLWFEYPDRYRELEGNWNDYLPKIQTIVKVSTEIRRIGRYTVTR